jgi:hypothetical protein
MNIENSLENVKVGDEVSCVAHSFHSYIAYTKIVTKVTATLVICGDIRISKKSSQEVSEQRYSSYTYYPSISPYIASMKKEKHEKAQLQSLVSKLEDAIKENRNVPDLTSSITDILSQFKIEKVA